jgi:hypothetical protein
MTNDFFLIIKSQFVNHLKEIVMYWNSILWFLSWPAVVVISYLLVKYTVLKYEALLEKPVKKANPEK